MTLKIRFDMDGVTSLSYLAKRVRLGIVRGIYIVITTPK